MPPTDKSGQGSSTPQAKLELSGTPADIKDVLEKRAPADGDDRGDAPDFFKWLTIESHDVSIHVDRIHPLRWKGRDIGGYIENFVPPIMFEDLQQKIKDQHGGGRFAVRIMVSGRVKTRRGFEIAGDPKIPEDDDEEGAIPPRGMGAYGHPGMYGPPYYGGGYGMAPAAPYAPRAPMITDINRDPEVIEKRKQMEMLKIEREMKKLNADVAGTDSQDKVKGMIEELNKQWEGRFNEMKQFYERKEHENQIDRLRTDFSTMITKLEDRLTTNGDGPRGSHAALKDLKADFDTKLSKFHSDMSENLRSLKDSKDNAVKEDMQRRTEDLIKELRRDSDAKIAALSTQGKGSMDHLKEYANVLSSVFTSSGERDKTLLNQMFEFFKVQMAAGQPQNNAEGNTDIDRFSQFLDIFAAAKDIMGGGSGTVETVPKDFGTAFLDVVREAIPQIVDAAKAKQGNVSREEVEQIIRHNVDMATKRAAANITAKQRQQPQPLPSGQAQGLEDTAPGQGGAPRDQQAQASAKTSEQIAQEAEAHRKQRLNMLAKAIAKELPSRPKITRWVQFALEDMPEEALARFCAAPSVQEFLAVLRPDVEVGYISFIEQQIADPAKMRWLSDTIGILKQEYAADKAEEEAEQQQQGQQPAASANGDGQETPSAMKQPEI